MLGHFRHERFELRSELRAQMQFLALQQAAWIGCGLEVLSRKHEDQPCGERRRGMFSTCGIRADSESAILIAR
jgi:hypothetical protein